MPRVHAGMLPSGLPPRSAPMGVRSVSSRAASSAETALRAAGASDASSVASPSEPTQRTRVSPLVEVAQLEAHEIAVVHQVEATGAEEARVVELQQPRVGVVDGGAPVHRL